QCIGHSSEPVSADGYEEARQDNKPSIVRPVFVHWLTSAFSLYRDIESDL
ncbi:MAG: hypothetical protein QG663_852, partial [Thermodesulfobacteriota bacterium]|nr:hypothetical protein [Thermodesulfobacteriota bacterium]